MNRSLWKLLNQSLVLIVAGFVSLSANATVLNFDITYDGTTQTVDAGSDAVLGAALSVGDGFILDFHADGNDYWDVTANTNAGLFLNFNVRDSAQRTADIYTTFYLDGVAVFSDVDLGLIQQNIHMGSQNVNMTAGLMFDAVVVDYSLLASTGTTTIIQNNGVYPFFSSLLSTDSNINYVNGPATVPEPGSLALLGLGLVGFGFRKLKAKV